MLSASDVSEDPELRSIVESTAAVVFMGTPHRGSLDMASLGEKARKFASAVRLDTNPKILDILGLKTSDLERCQESFSRIWAKYDFRVKTFQEGLGLTGAHLGILNDKVGMNLHLLREYSFGCKQVVPSYSSLLGDAREHAETLQANHMDMCRFSGFQDPNFIKVGGEISRIYTSITKFRIPQSDHVWSLGSSGAPADQRSPDLDHVEKGSCPSSTLSCSIVDTPLYNQRVLNNYTFQGYTKEESQPREQRTVPAGGFSITVRS
jgi:hypothetical protein